MHKELKRMQRRNFLKYGAASLGGAIASSVIPTQHAFGTIRTHPHASSLTELDQNSYIKDMKVHAHFNEAGHRAGKMNMMATGERRFMFTNGDFWEVTDPLNPKIINKNALRGAPGFQVQLAYAKHIRKWILMVSGGQVWKYTERTDDNPYGKYAADGAERIARAEAHEGLRGVVFYDCTDPYDVKLLSKWSCDQGDPERPLQEGDGGHRSYYDGGKYAYLDVAPDNSFIRQESASTHYAHCLQIIDVEDPTNPKFVANWWVPGQRLGEEDAYRLWREYGDRESFTAVHGGPYVPVKVEDGGKYCYMSYGSFGLIVLDVSNPTEPKKVCQWRPHYLPGPAIAMHTMYVPWADRGLVISTAESYHSDCFEPFHPNYVIDISDFDNPRKVAEFGRWTPPPDAPYDDFCDARGRMGTHNPPHLKAPGTPHPTFVPFAAFNAGLQNLDFSDPARVASAGYYIPKNAGTIDKPKSYYRLGESVFVEWDRRLIWAGFNSGTYCLSHPMLGEPILEAAPVDSWSLPGLNAGWND
jgi:hypothetical protein